MVSSNTSVEAILDVAQKAATEAAKTSLAYFKEAVDVDYKGDESPVTIADRETETVLRNIIGEAFPDHGIFGEEHGKQNMDAEYIWVLDPIDGTKSFITGIPLFGMLISVVHNNLPMASVVHMPALGETFIGAVGKDARNNNGEMLKVRACSSLSEALCFIGEADKMFEGAPGLYEKIQKKTRLARFGYDCYPYVKVAAGKIDVMIERNLQPYDFCALVPVVEGAGGIITDWDGNRLTMDSDGDVLACGDPKVHAEMLSLIQEWKSENNN
ncbi:histidinol-phosphatase [Curvivirga sp.]|uniref:histidinol-phosphatase n=1 Tax=Curvivirga sp. TaxID=2856848 RepID=UPI003B5ABB57